MKRFKPTLWLSFGLVSLTLALALTAYMLGLIPDGYKAEIESRAKVAESLAVQLAGAVNRNNNVTLHETINSVVNRNSDINSVAIRGVSNNLIVFAGDHEKHWISSSDGRSTPTHVSVPLLGVNGNPQGSIEIAFGPASSSNRILGFPTSLLLFLSFLMASGFIGYFFILRRTLKQLDPGRVIPERVQKAFDTLSEGVIILDEKERILLVNNAFAKIYGGDNGPTLGVKMNHLPWRMVDGSKKSNGYPWHIALREGREMREGILSLRSESGNIHNFNVNATVIAGDKDKTIGAIVTLRDMTGEKRTKEDLDKTLDDLRQVQSEVKRQNRELTYLANHDSLTGCLNRRAYFGRFQTEMDQAPDLGTPISTIMIAFDQYKEINKKFGPVTGDALIIGVANIIKAECQGGAFVSRHAGEKFSIALVDVSEADTIKLVEKIQNEIAISSRELLPAGQQATISVGIAIRTNGSCTAHTLVNKTELAANQAIRNGRNQIITWEENLSQNGNIDDSETKQNKTPTTIQNPTAELIAKSPENNLRDSFYSRANASLMVAEKSNTPLAMLHLSLTAWEYLDEALGTELRQKILLSVEQKVAISLREHDAVLSLNENGEWLIKLAGLESADDVKWIIMRLLETMHVPILIGGKSIHVSCKIGAALFPENGRDIPTLARQAKMAMRRAWEDHLLDGYKFYEANMTDSSIKRLNVENGIRNALQQGDFELFFQPIVNAETGALSAAEALLRCNNAELKGIPIDQVIHVAEKTSLIAEIDMWVLKSALKQMQNWINVGLELPKLSINISAQQLNNIAFMDQVFDTIKDVSFSPSRVQLEITETAQMGDVEIAAPQLKRLQQLGVQIALDDFGTGQASLTYLQRLHPDVIKIDSSFVNGINTNHANATMVSAMVVMAHCLGLKVVAEGVETEEQLEFLRETNCDEIQGYLIAKPMPVKVLDDWMKLFIKNNGAGLFVIETDANDQKDASSGLKQKAA